MISENTIIKMLSYNVTGLDNYVDKCKKCLFRILLTKVCET